MGGDGGTLLNKRKLLNRSRVHGEGGADDGGCKSDQAAAAAMDRNQRWHFCALTNRPLRSPVVCDLRGDLYNKASVVDMLLRRREVASEGSNMSDSLAHISKLRDVRELVLKGGNDDDDAEFTVVCPLTFVRADSGAQVFVASWRCGHVMSAAAWTDGEACPLCEDDSDGSPTFAVRLILSDVDAAKQLELLKEAAHRPKRPRTDHAQ
jgi:hypothetical protein